MEKETYLFNLLYQGWQLPAFCYDEALTELHRFPKEGLTLTLPETLVKTLWDECERKQGILVYAKQSSVYFMAFFAAPGAKPHFYILGPAALEPLSFAALMEHKKEYGIHGDDTPFPVIPWRTGMSLLSFSYTYLTGQPLSAAEILKPNTEEQGVRHEELERYEYSRELSEKYHLAYSEEQAWISDIENGLMDAHDFSMTPENMRKLDSIGELSANSFKQMEYMAVTAIVLASRAAIRGGVSTFEAYSVSDLYFQKVERCRDVTELLAVYIEVARDFSDRVRKAKENRSEDIVEQACDYIARHRTHRIQISEMAHEIGVSPGYLSRKFTEGRGMTLQDYIMKQRLSAGANMLTYSDLTVGEIAEYLSFSSQSHFGHYFRDEYGLTPQQYRKLHKIIDFENAAQ